MRNQEAVLGSVITIAIAVILSILFSKITACQEKSQAIDAATTYNRLKTYEVCLASHSVLECNVNRLP
jgi:hypothetical protein